MPQESVQTAGKARLLVIPFLFSVYPSLHKSLIRNLEDILEYMFMLTLYVSRFSLIMVCLNRLGTGPLTDVVVDLGDGVMH